MNTLIRTALLVGIVGFGGFAAYRLSHPVTALVIELTCDGESQGQSSMSAAWGSENDASYIHCGSDPFRYHLHVKVLSGDSGHATFSYLFDSTRSSIARGAMTVGDKASLGQSRLQLDNHVSLLAYVQSHP
jgi:hypothetical protein